MQADDSLIMVVGMHRSGTSLLMALLDNVGLETGRQIDQIASTENNPTGHWELAAMARLNDAVLEAVGSHWSAPVSSDAEALAGLADGELGDRARQMRGDELAGVDVAKDPRFCLTLPFWRAVLDDALVLLAPWRHPSEVAGSLSSRNHFPDPYGRWLWTEYHRQLHLHARGLPRLLCPHRSLVDAPSEQLDAIDAYLTQFLDHPPRMGTIEGTMVDAGAINHRADSAVSHEDSLLLSALEQDARLSPIDGPSEDRRVAFGAVAITANDRDQTRWRLHAMRMQK
jgi:hypothetical protein